MSKHPAPIGGTRLRLFQVDAFTDTVFRGNPAAVVPLEEWLSDAQMQSIAAENNLAETAFFVPQGDDYGLRWFTPTQEVPLCGHATLATAFVVFDALTPSAASVRFHTQRGALTVTREDTLLVLDFPCYVPTVCTPPARLLEGLGAPPREVLKTAEDTNFYESEAEVRALRPDMRALAQLHTFGAAVTAPGEFVDFVSRYFAPGAGIPEDPVTGSTHCALTPYWAKRLGKDRLRARQLSPRGGELFCALRGGRVAIAGAAVKYLEGEIGI